MTRTCYEVKTPAPRPGCKCMECSWERERYLDPTLVALARRSGLTSTPSQGLIHAGITRYLIGEVELGSMYILIIEALAKQSDRMFNDQLQLLKMSPHPQPIMPKSAG